MSKSETNLIAHPVTSSYMIISTLSITGVISLTFAVLMFCRLCAFSLF